MPRQRRVSARSVASSESTTAISPGRRRATARAARTTARSGAASAAGPRRLGARLATEIGIGAAPAGLPGLLGIGHAHGEDSGQHRDEGLAPPRQLLEREPALVELALLDPLLAQAR